MNLERDLGSAILFLLNFQPILRKLAISKTPAQSWDISNFQSSIRNQRFRKDTDYQFKLRKIGR